MNDIFISYSRHDTDVVNEIVTLLEQEGYSIWIDRDGIESGEDFKRVILKAIKESKVVLFFSSEHSNVSDWTAKEIGVAVKYKKHIIPIKLDDSNFNEAVEFDLINLDYIDYSKSSIQTAMRDKLLKTLRNKIGNGSKELERLEAERRTKEEAERARIERERLERIEAERKAKKTAERERLKHERKTRNTISKPDDEPAQSKGKTFFQKAWPWGLSFLVFEIVYTMMVSYESKLGVGNGVTYGIVFSWPFILLFAVFFVLSKRFVDRFKALPWVVAGLSTMLYLFFVISLIH